MDVIFMPKHWIWKRLQCAHILSLLMHFHSENMYCSAVLTVHVSIFLNKKKIIGIKKKTSIRFHVYHIIGRCNDHGKIPVKDKNICYMCKQESSPDESTKIYTRKELVIMETTIYDFHTSFYIPAIQKLAFHLPHVGILGTNHCGAIRHTAFKQRELFQDILYLRDYAERVVANFSNQI